MIEPSRLPWSGARLLLAALAFLAGYLVWSPAAAVADPALEVLQLGWDGNVVPGAWIPVRVRIVGGDADLNARVEVVLKARYQQGPQGATIEYPVGAYGQEMALPAGVTKEVTLWALGNGAPLGAGIGMAGSVRLLAGGHTLAEEKIQFRETKTPFWPVIGVLAESPTTARTLAQAELPVQGLPVPLSVARLSAADLPSSAERLSALSALVVQGNAAAALTGEQRRAVQDWVAAGGHLLLAGGPDAPRAIAVLPPDALPVAFAGSDAGADLAPLVRWAGMHEPAPAAGPTARFQAGVGSLLAGTPDRPLAWRLGLGQGTVTLLAVDPALEPLAGWSGTSTLLLKALEPALPDPSDNDKMRYLRLQEGDISSRLQGAVEALPPEAYPDWQTVALILAGFALVVGPLAHLLLWRVDRRQWVWLAVPAAALLVSGALYAIGIGWGGRDVLVNVVSHLELDPTAGQARETLAAGFFAPTHPELTVGVPGDAAVQAGTRQNTQMFGPGGPIPEGMSTEPPFHVLSGRDTRIEFPSGQWGMRMVTLARTLGREAGSITASLGLEEGLIRGTLRNDTPYPLEDAAVVIGQSLVKLGNLSPGQSAPVALDPGEAANPFQGGFPLSWRLFGHPVGSGGGGIAAGSSGYAPAVPVPAPALSLSSSYSVGIGPSGAPERLDLPQDPEVQRRVRLMDPLINTPRPGPGGPAVPLTFLAFTRAPVGADLPSAGNHPTYYLALVEQSLGLTLPPGPFTLPAALTPVEVLAQTGGWGGGGNGTLFWVQLSGGSITYGFRPPLPPGGEVEALNITTQQVGQSTTATPGKGAPPQPPGPNLAPGPAEAGLFSVYNWQSANWDPLPGGQEQTRLEPATPYLGPEGLVKVQLSAGADRQVSVVQPSLVVEGRAVE